MTEEAPTRENGDQSCDGAAPKCSLTYVKGAFDDSKWAGEAEATTQISG